MIEKKLFEWMVCRDILSYERIGPKEIKHEAEKYMKRSNITAEQFNEEIKIYNEKFVKSMMLFFGKE